MAKPLYQHQLPLQLPGRIAEDETEESGYNVFEARLYDPVIGRWISVDPARQFASGYVGMGNNPVNGVDPDGRWSDPPNGKHSNPEITYATFIIPTAEGLKQQFKEQLLRPLEITKAYLDLKFANRPHFISVGAGFTGIAGVGGGESVELTWITVGPEASLLPVLSTTPSVGTGYSVDATLNIGAAYYTGNTSDVSRDMVTTSIKAGDVTTWIGGGVAAGGKLGVTGTFTPQPNNQAIIGGEFNFGGGLPMPSGPAPIPVNGATGTSNTFILYDFNDVLQ
ncbi:RHS repeat-associated core domain-containing protein [Persicobacter diffluens]|uniref:RHS repeat-associated core domain-containing protein n=1 Tax=Persicobacter diffluens TaxID=981 RepID=A0AAN5AMB7_9BACT|nr:hypothetical protein PEDI_42090 [Persicobacter diffluens]